MELTKGAPRVRAEHEHDYVEWVRASLPRLHRVAYRVLGPRDPDSLRTRAELARVYHQLGRYGDARALLRDTVGRLERILPPNDPLITELREILTDIGDE